MKKTVRSAQATSTAPSKNKSKPADLPNPSSPMTPERESTASRKQVRQEIHRTQVPRQSERPAERSNQRRSNKP